MTGLWIAVGVLAVILVASWVAGFLLLAMGRLHLDLGWGRSVHELGPIEIRIAAPRDLVFELISEPYLGRTPRESGIEVLARDKDLAVAVHHTRVHFYDARTVEMIEFEAPTRVAFRHLTGPVPHAVEEFALEEAGGVTELREVAARGFMIVTQDFQDPYTLDVEKLRKCCVSEIAPDGRLIPFCAYNSVGYRERVRLEMSQATNGAPRRDGRGH